MKTLTVALGILGLALPAAADELQLKNGAKFEGVVHEKGEQVVVELDFGTMSFPKKDVASITRAAVPLHELEEKVKGARDAEGHYQVGLWAAQNGLATRSKDHYRRAIELDADHEKARAALGYVKHEDRWLTHDELMAARGLVLHDGRWITVGERAKLREKELQVQLETIRLQALIEAARRQQEMMTAQHRTELERQDQLRRAAVRTSTLPLHAVPFSLPLSGVPWGLPLGIPQEPLAD